MRDGVAIEVELRHAHARRIAVRPGFHRGGDVKRYFLGILRELYRLRWGVRRQAGQLGGRFAFKIADLLDLLRQVRFLALLDGSLHKRQLVVLLLDLEVGELGAAAQRIVCATVAAPTTASRAAATGY